MRCTVTGVLSMSAFSEDVPPTHYIAQYLGHFNPGVSEESAIYFETRGEFICFCLKLCICMFQKCYETMDLR